MLSPVIVKISMLVDYANSILRFGSFTKELYNDFLPLYEQVKAEIKRAEDMFTTCCHAYGIPHD